MTRDYLQRKAAGVGVCWTQGEEGLRVPSWTVLRFLTWMLGER